MLDRLVRRTILADADRIVGEHEHGRDLHDRRQPDRRAHVIGKYQERGRVGAQVGQRHAVGDRPHGMFAHAEVHVLAGIIVRLKPRRALDVGLGRGREVRRPAQQARQMRRHRVQHLPARVARGEALGIGGEGGDIRLPALGQLARAQQVELLGFGRVGLSIALEQRLPGLAQGRTAVGHRPGEGCLHAIGNVEALVVRPAIGLLGDLHVLHAQRLAMRLGAARAGAAPADHRADDDQRRPVVGGLERIQRGLEGGGIVGVIDMDDVPVVPLEALAHILGKGQFGRALDRDRVAVIDPAQVREPQVPRDRRRLARDAFHHVAIAAEHVDVVIDDREAIAVVTRSQSPLGDRHAHRIAATLPQRPGGGFHPGGHAVFRVAGGFRPHLAEVLDVGQAHRRQAGLVAVGVDFLDPGQVQRRIEQHRGMPDREHEPIPVGPIGMRRVIAQHIVPQRIHHRRQRHRGSGVARIGLLHGIHGQRADGIDGEAGERTVLPQRIGGVGGGLGVGHEKGIPFWTPGATDEPPGCFTRRALRKAFHPGFVPR